MSFWSMAAMLIGTFDNDSSRRVAVTVISRSTSSSAANTMLGAGQGKRCKHGG